MAFTQTDLDAVNAAIASGELSVEVSGRRVVYRSMDDLLKARSLIAGDVAVSTTGLRRSNYRFTFATHRGE
jgi:hypothetical protein